MKRLLWMVALLAVLLAGCQGASWKWTPAEHSTASNHVGQATVDKGETVITATQEYEVIRLPDGSYFVRPINGGPTHE